MIDFEAINNTVSIFEAANEGGWTTPIVSRPTQVHCPFHADERPSARIYPITNSLHCFACHKSWNSLSLFADLQGVSIVDAANILAVRFNVSERVTNYAEQRFSKALHRTVGRSDFIAMYCAILESAKYLSIPLANFQQIFGIMNVWIDKQDSEWLFGYDLLMEEWKEIRWKLENVVPESQS